MSSIFRGKSPDLVLITLFNLDGLETQSMQSFRVENTSTVFDLITNLKSRYPNSSEIELYFEDGQKFTSHQNTYLINIIRAKQDRVVKYRVIENNFVTPLNRTNYQAANESQNCLPTRPGSANLLHNRNGYYAPKGKLQPKNLPDFGGQLYNVINPLQQSTQIPTNTQNSVIAHSKIKILNQGQINQHDAAIQQQFQESEPESKQIQDKETSYHQRISELEQKNSSLQIYLDEEKQKNMQLKQTISQLEENQVELKVKQQLELQRLSQQMTQSTNNNEKQRLQRENQSLIGQQQDLSQRIESLQKENNELRRQLQQMNNSQQQLKYENEQLKSQLKLQDQSISQMEINLITQFKENDEQQQVQYEQIFKELRQQIEKLKNQDLKHQEEVIEKQKNEIKQLNQQFQKLKKENDEKLKDSDLNEILVNENKQLRQKLLEVEDAEQRQDWKIELYEVQQKKIDDLLTQIKEIKMMNSDLSVKMTQLQSTQKENLLLKTLLSSEQQKYQELQIEQLKQYQSLANQITSLKFELEETKKSQEQYQLELLKIQKNLSEENYKFKQCLTVKQQLQNENFNLAQENEKLQSQLTNNQ